MDNLPKFDKVQTVKATTQTASLRQIAYEADDVYQSELVMKADANLFGRRLVNHHKSK